MPYQRPWCQGESSSLLLDQASPCLQPLESKVQVHPSLLVTAVQQSGPQVQVEGYKLAVSLKVREGRPF